ncbi:MAG: hypothetical protein ABJB97_04795 [Acidobacteriota bacterium]
MGTFTLKKEATTFDCSSLGKVKKGAADFGTWTTSKDNKIVIKGKDGTQTPIDVIWKINSFNELCVLDSANKSLFNFHSDGVVPFFSANKAVLQVFADENEEFSFELRGEWDLTATHDLSITINNVTSVIDGYIDDPESRFSYHFFDKVKNPFNVIFVGAWKQTTDDKGVPRLDFKYAREDGTSDVFSLPEEITIDRSVNQFVYQYNKKNKTRRIRLVGLLNVTPDFRITYSIDRQDSDEGSTDVKSTTFEIRAVLAKSKFEGEIELLVKKSDGKAGKTVLGLKGSFTARPGGNVIKVGFEFAQERNGAMTKTTVLFNGKLTLKNSLTEVQWEFGVADNVKTLVVTISDVKLGSVTVDSKFVLKSGNGNREVLLLLGFKF